MIELFASVEAIMTNLNTSFFEINAQQPNTPSSYKEAAIEISRLSTQSRPIGLSFSCTRYFPNINPKIANIYANVINGKASQDMTQNTFCPHDAVTGSCGNKRGHLSECRCSVLDRTEHPEIRHEYENQVIAAVFNILKGSNIAPFHLKLAVFCSSELLGEQILLFRLLNELKKNNLSGSIELFFVDHCYSQAIANSRHGGSFEQAVGGEKYIEQFLQEICYALPSNIQVSGTFFDDGATYISAARADPKFKHHLLIGADIENANFDMGTVGREAGLGLRAPITLAKRPIPALCHLDEHGNFKNCYNPSANSPLVTQPHRRSPINPMLYGILIAVVFGVIAAIAFKILTKKPQPSGN